MPPQRLVWWSVYALVLTLAPLVFDSSLSLTLLSQMGIAIIVCLSYNILLGQGGMLSFGHAVYSGVGAFLAIHTLNGFTGLPVSLIPVAGGLGSAAVALLLGWVCTQKSGTPFAMITLGVGELVWAMAQMLPGFFGGEAGISGNRVVGSQGISFGPPIQMVYLVAVYTFVCTAMMFALTCTPLGRMLNAVRDNPERVEFIGYNPRVIRWMAFVIAAFFAGISGGLAALHFEMVSTDVFSSTRSGAYLLFTYLGGTTLFLGPIVGAVLMVLAQVCLSEFTRAWLLYLGLIFIVMVRYAPGGVACLIMLNLRLARGVHRLWIGYLALFASFCVALLGASAMVEMIYHLQQGDALGPMLPFMGGTLNAKGVNSWLGAAFVIVTGWGLFELCRCQFVKDRHKLSQADVEF